MDVLILYLYCTMRKPYGGMIPKGRLAEDGVVPEEFTDMVESESEDYRFRTRWNVEHADATLILSFAEELEGGSQRTRQYCMNVRKPYFVDNPLSPKSENGRIAVFKWLENVSRKNGGRPSVLNVAGPRESKFPGIAEAAEKYVGRLIAAQRHAEEDLQKMDLIDLKVWFRESYAIQMAEQGIDVVEQVPAWLPKINVMTTERVSANELLVHRVPRAQALKVKQSIKDGVVDKLGWTEEPSHVVVISVV